MERRADLTSAYRRHVPDLAAALDGAVARGEMEVWFQPQSDLSTNLIVGAEALCRWTHPCLGPIPPSRFIPIAEERGQIDEIGRFVADAGCRAFTRWSRIRPIDVSVNVSPKQLDDSEFVTWLASRLRRLRMGSRGYTVEITESQPINDTAAVVRRLEILRREGATVSIDDFGTGQASMTQLRRLHGAELKVDRSLVEDASAMAVSVLRRVVAAAHAAHVRVVAEGIETPEQLARVRRLGIDRAQGYLIGRPMPEARLTEVLRAA